jgi:hypothetical protein
MKRIFFHLVRAPQSLAPTPGKNNLTEEIFLSLSLPSLALCQLLFSTPAFGTFLRLFSEGHLKE